VNSAEFPSAGQICLPLYEAYLRGVFTGISLRPNRLKAINLFKKSNEIDPNYALPYVGVADFILATFTV